jgi:uncharacterized protein YoxC
VTPPRDTLGGIDDAIALFEQALKAVRQIPKQGQHGVAVDGIEHELMALTERLRSLRDDVAGKGERAE